MIETDLSSKDIEDAEALRPEPEVPPTTAELVAGGEVEPVIQAGEEEQVAGLGSAIKALKGTKVAPPIKRVTEEQADSFLERQAVGKIVDPARTDQRNFSLKYINDPEDIDNELNRLMDDMAEEMEFGSYPGMEARSHEQTKEDAKKVQVDIEKFIGRKLRSAPENAAELTIWRQMLLDSARELKDMSGKVVDPITGQRSMNASDADLYEFRQAMYRYAAIQMKFQGAVKEVGRMLNAMKIPIGADPLAGQDMTSILLSEGQGIHGTLKMASAVYNAQTPEEVAALARGTF